MPKKKEKKEKKEKTFLEEHSLSLVAGGILLLWVVLYSVSDPETRMGAFFGNSVADWTGVVVAVIGTKFLFERGSKESNPVRARGGKLKRFAIEHSLSIVLILTGLGWVLLYSRLEATSRWGQVVGNVVSEWVQLLGFVLLTKALIERGSEESK
jgi:hypothetical protein